VAPELHCAPWFVSEPVADASLKTEPAIGCRGLTGRNSQHRAILVAPTASSKPRRDSRRVNHPRTTKTNG
jgi:hypothetical protein